MAKLTISFTPAALETVADHATVVLSLGNSILTNLSKATTTTGLAIAVSDSEDDPGGIGAIASQEAFGSLRAYLIVRNVGAIASAEAFGRPTVRSTQFTQTISAAGGINQEQSEFVGLLMLTGSTRLIGIPIVVQLGGQVTGVGAIGSGEAFGTATITRGQAPLAFQHDAYQANDNLRSPTDAFQNTAFQRAS